MDASSSKADDSQRCQGREPQDSLIVCPVDCDKIREQVEVANPGLKLHLIKLPISCIKRLLDECEIIL